MDIVKPKHLRGGVKSRPMFWLIAAVLVAVYWAYRSGRFTELPCGPGWLEAFKRNFVHVDLTHLAANLVSFWILSRIELAKGSKHYAALILVLLVLFTTGEVLLHLGQGPQKCAIGFSGILFGLLAWEIVTNHANLNGQLFVGLLLTLVGTSFKNPKASLQGHALGVAVGLLAGFGTRIIQSRANRSA